MPYRPVQLLVAIDMPVLLSASLWDILVRRLGQQSPPQSWGWAVWSGMNLALYAHESCKTQKHEGMSRCHESVAGSPSFLLIMLTWIAVVSGAALRANWTRIIEWYRMWQYRHGHFTLEQPLLAPGSRDGDIVIV